MCHLETTEVFLVDFSVVNNYYQQKLRFLCTVVPDKSFGQLLDVFPKYFTFLKMLNSEFLYIK